MATRAPYRIHRMIQDLLRDPQAAQTFARDPYPAFASYGITEAEAALLEAGTIESMTRLGVHPNLQMKYLRLRKAPSEPGTQLPPGPLDAYLDRLRGTQ